jgi:hypothetical protein
MESESQRFADSTGDVGGGSDGNHDKSQKPKSKSSSTDPTDLSDLPSSPSLPRIFFSMEQEAPHFLRVKEIFEAVETFLLVQKFVAAQGARCQSIFDLGCGNGLLGIMCAYRFPDKVGSSSTAVLYALAAAALTYIHHPLLPPHPLRALLPPLPAGGMPGHHATAIIPRVRESVQSARGEAAGVERAVGEPGVPRRQSGECGGP